MGDESDNPIDPKSLYKSAEIIDVESEEYEEEELLSQNNKYKRITKQWLIAQEISYFTLFLSGSSWIFLVFRAVNWFPLVLGSIVLCFLVIGVIFSLSWGKLKVLDKVRLFLLGLSVALGSGISGSDIIYLTFMNNQLLILSLVVSVLVLITLIGILIYRKTKVLRY
jgi:hypothetical protein